MLLGGSRHTQVAMGLNSADPLFRQVLVLDAPLQHGYDEGRRLAGSGARHANHVLALQNERHRAPLDGRGKPVTLPLDAAHDYHVQSHRLCVESVKGLTGVRTGV